jgi:CheY-like chemotaxis protein
VSSKQWHILLADDDIDDCDFFTRALNELPVSTRLTAVHDGEQLIKHLTSNLNDIPDVIFLDLSMPRKTGFECLAEIKQSITLKDIPVFVFSTSFTRDLNYERNLIGTLSSIGAQEYIRKPGDFEQLKKVIYSALVKVTDKAPVDQNPVADISVQNAEIIPQQPVKTVK